MTTREAYRKGWNDACWGRPYRPQDLPEHLRRAYRNGWMQYEEDNPK